MNRYSNGYARKYAKRRSRLIRLMIGLLFACAAFAAGFFVRGNVEFLTSLGFETGAYAEDANPGMTVSGSTYDSLSARLAEVQGILDTNSIDQYDLDSTTSQMLDVLAKCTNDPFVGYLDQSHYDTYLSASSDTYKGIGVLFAENQGQAYAVDVFAGSEAESKDVKPGDYVVAIGGDRGSDGWTQAEVVNALNEIDSGTAFITWRRPASLDAEGGEEYSVELSISAHEEPNVIVELDDNKVGYIKLSQITSNSVELVSDAIEKLTSEGATSFVLDLRDNPGGYLSQAIDIGSLFVQSGTFVEVYTKDSTLAREVSGKTATDAPLVVLVNEKTGAAAEVLAGGLKDNDRAVVVGETTQGKGTVQSISQLSFGGGLRYTSAYFKTPKGYEIDGIGINPDVQISSGDDSEDAQKAFAVDMSASLANQ